MSPVMEVRLLMMARSEWQYRLFMGGGSIVTADGDEVYPDANAAMKAAVAAAKAETAQRLAHRTGV